MGLYSLTFSGGSRLLEVPGAGSRQGESAPPPGVGHPGHEVSDRLVEVEAAQILGRVGNRGQNLNRLPRERQSPREIACVPRRMGGICDESARKAWVQQLEAGSGRANRPTSVLRARVFKISRDVTLEIQNGIYISYSNSDDTYLFASLCPFYYNIDNCGLLRLSRYEYANLG